MWIVTIETGVFWNGPTYQLGAYWWRWVAGFSARVHLIRHPYRIAVISAISPPEHVKGRQLVKKVLVLSRNLRTREPIVRVMVPENIGGCIPGEEEISLEDARRLFNTSDVDFTRAATVVIYSGNKPQSVEGSKNDG